MKETYKVCPLWIGTLLGPFRCGLLTDDFRGSKTPLVGGVIPTLKHVSSRRPVHNKRNIRQGASLDRCLQRGLARRRFQTLRCAIYGGHARPETGVIRVEFLRERGHTMMDVGDDIVCG